MFANRRKLLLLILTFTTFWSGRRFVAAEDAKPTVSLTIDYGDGVEKRFTSLTWKDGMTVFDATEQAAKHSRGIRFEHRGAAATAFLISIDGLRNEGKGRNWTYRVNGELADRSFAVYPLDPNDHVLWKFSDDK